MVLLLRLAGEKVRFSFSDASQKRCAAETLRRSVPNQSSNFTVRMERRIEHGSFQKLISALKKMPNRSSWPRLSGMLLVF
jgi:hypothetical protein